MSDKDVLKFSSAQPRSPDDAPLPFRAILVPSWQRARDLSCSALLAGEMCVVVTGPPGIGKTQLVGTVARVLRSTGWTIAIFTARLPADAEFAALTGSAAILIDDADRLSAVELRTLNRLRQCSVLLAGGTGFEKRCPADSRVTLAPLPREEVTNYVALWLERASLSPHLVGQSAVAHLADVSAGIPRLLAILLASSLKAARADGSDQIEEHHIDNAAWHHVEHTAARRLHRVTSPAPPTSARPAPARTTANLEERLSQAPFADVATVDKASPLLSSRALGWVGLGLSAGLLATAAVLTWPQWSRRVTAVYGAIVPALGYTPVALAPLRLDPPVMAATPPVPEPDVVAPAMPAVEQSSAAEIATVPPAQVGPPVSPVPVQVPVQTPPDTVVVAASSQPSPAPVETAPVDIPPPLGQASVPPSPAADPLSQSVIKLLNLRGQQMLDLNDFSAARLLFSRAAESGSVKAMLALGRSYDPSVTRSPASAVDMDPAQAAQWYRKAAALGSSDAVILLQQLERGPRE